MSSIYDIFKNDILICCFISWWVAQTFKVPILFLVEKKFSFKRFIGSGGMPSSHTALVSALCVMIGHFYGFDSGIFAISFCFSAVVMYDAAGVRRETGTQATVINKLLERIGNDGEPIRDSNLKEIIGHTPLEVLGGFIVGVAVSLIYISFM